MKNKTIALIAHDRRKFDLVGWAKFNANTLYKNKLVCTGTTGSLIQKVMIQFMKENNIDLSLLDITMKNSGPLGGDAQIASMVVEKKIDLCIFLIDDLNANPHEADIQMLLRQCRVHNIPVACNRASADFMITSNLWNSDYESLPPTYVNFEREK